MILAKFCNRMTIYLYEILREGTKLSLEPQK